MKRLVNFCLIVLLFWGCERDPFPEVTPMVATGDVKAISYSDASVSLILNCLSNCREIGIVFSSTNQNPTYSNSQVKCIVDAWEMSVGENIISLTGLSANTIYYYRSYVKSEDDFIYGNVMTFTTKNAGFGNTVTDIDGNVYHSVIIGSQVWMVENLKTTRYRNGNYIPNVTFATSWGLLTSGAYCDYMNTPSNSSVYGRLYNFYVVADSRKIAPYGWHIPTDAEWETLANYLGGFSVAGGKLKETGFTHWSSPNTGATNVSGFTALPGGQRSLDGSMFYGKGSWGQWWSSSMYNTSCGSFLIFYNANLSQIFDDKRTGYSVRCIKDN